MKKPPTGRGGTDQIFSLLDDALLDVLSEVPDSGLTERARRARVAGLGLLALASACMFAVALLPMGRYILGTLLLGGAAILLLVCGGWLLDQASNYEIRAHRFEFTDALTDVLRDADLGLMQAKICRRRYFGIGMLVLSGFCMSVASAPLPGKQLLDTLMWAGFSVALIAVGTWQMRRSAGEALQARNMASAARRRQAATTGTHLGRVS